MEQKKHLLLLFALFFLLSLACGELLVPVEQAGSGSGQPGNSGAPESEIAEPLETLAPLPESSDEETTADVEGQESDPENAGIIVIDDIAWTLLDAVYLGETLESDTDEIADLVANGRLIGIRFTLTNQGEELHTFIGLDLVDSTGERTSYMGDSLDFIIDEEACDLIELEPGDTVTCTAIYDIPVESNGLQAAFNNLSLIGGEEKLVDLGID